MTVAFSSRVLLWCYQSAITFFISSSSGSHSSNKFRCSLPYLIRAVQPFLPWLLLNHGTENVLMKFTDTSLWLSQWTLYSSSFSQSLTCIQTVECNLVLKDFFFSFSFLCFWPLNLVILFVDICFSLNFIMDMSQMAIISSSQSVGSIIIHIPIKSEFKSQPTSLSLSFRPRFPNVLSYPHMYISNANTKWIISYLT